MIKYSDIVFTFKYDDAHAICLKTSTTTTTKETRASTGPSLIECIKMNNHVQRLPHYFASLMYGHQVAHARLTQDGTVWELRVPPGHGSTGVQGCARRLRHSAPSASSWFQLSCDESDRLSCETRVTFSGALMLNTNRWWHDWKLSELTVLSVAGPHIYIPWSLSVWTFKSTLILNPCSVDLPKSTER